jgi:hypothetical protein
VDANREYPGMVNCYFAGNIEFDKSSGRMCVKWDSCRSTDPSYCYHPLGGTGVIYPLPYLMALKRAGSAFESCCPIQDDIWHHVMALRAGYRVRQILPLPPYFAFQSIPGTHRTALKGRDGKTAISATYKESDIELLRADYGVTPR